MVSTDAQDWVSKISIPGSMLCSFRLFGHLRCLVDSENQHECLISAVVWDERLLQCMGMSAVLMSL